MPTATINGRLIHWADEHYAGFWARAERGDWQPHTFQTLDRHLSPDATVIDVGAHIGIISLYAATIAQRVISLEPDPISIARLRRNLAMNPVLAERILLIPRALSPSRGDVTLSSLTTGGDSMSSTVFTRPRTTWTVGAVTPEDVAAEIHHDGPLFVKIDVEGGEYELIPAGRPLWDRNDVTILLSTHPQILRAAGCDAKLRDRTLEMIRALEDFDRTLLGGERQSPFGWARNRIEERWPRLTANAPRDWLFLKPSHAARRGYRPSARSAAHR